MKCVICSFTTHPPPPPPPSSPSLYKNFLLQCNYEYETQDDNILFVFITATNVFTPPPGDVCSGDSVTFSCSRDDSVMEWSYNGMLVVIFNEQIPLGTDTHLVDGINFTVALIFLNNTVTTSNISFTAPAAADGKVLACTGGGVTSKKNIRVVTSGMSL